MKEPEVQSSVASRKHDLSRDRSRPSGAHASPLSSRLATALFAILAGLAACTPREDPCFAPSWSISGTRLLAVRADPPEARFDVLFAAPEVRVRALVVNVNGELGDVGIAARLCVPTDDPGCPAASMSHASTDTNALVAPPSLIESALADDPLKGYAGVRVRADLVLSSGTESFSAEKLLLYSPSTGSEPPNGPLEVSGFSVTRKGFLFATAAPGTTVVLEQPFEYGLRPILVEGAGAETYTTVDLSGRRVQLREHVTWNFFTTPGLPLGKATPTPAGPAIRRGPLGPPVDEADEPDPGVERPDGLVRMNAFGDGTVWAVARDGRGAVAWGRLQVKTVCNLEPAGLCSSSQFDCR